MSGKVEAVFEAHCGLCERPALALGKTKSAALAELRRLGWREHVALGWCCDECRKPFTTTNPKGGE